MSAEKRTVVGHPICSACGAKIKLWKPERIWLHADAKGGPANKDCNRP